MATHVDLESMHKEFFKETSQAQLDTDAAERKESVMRKKSEMLEQELDELNAQQKSMNQRKAYLCDL